MNVIKAKYVPMLDTFKLLFSRSPKAFGTASGILLDAPLERCRGGCFEEKFSCRESCYTRHNVPPVTPQILALRTANILNQADVAKDSGISLSTTHRYIKLLEISNIVHRIPGYFSNRGKRLVKSPKVHFIDPALSIFLSGYLDKESLSRARELGHYFETMVHLHLRALCEMMKPKAAIYYWRTVTGKDLKGQVNSIV